MVLVKQYDGRKPLIDIVEDSPFKPFDTIKITYRLAQLGAIVRRETRESTPLTSGWRCATGCSATATSRRRRGRQRRRRAG